MDPARQKRKEEISKALTFIQSSLAYPEPQGYQDFLTQLVCNLLEEANALFREREWEQAVKEFSEGLNVARYAAAEGLQIREALLESLYVNRAAAYHSMGEYDQGVKDCDRALKVCKESRRALYRKALCLKELGKYREAYNCTTDCLLITRLDKQVNELAQELAVQLGLKNRKPYVSSKEDALIIGDVANGSTTTTTTTTTTTPTEAIKVPGGHLGNGTNPLSGLPPVSFPGMPPPHVSSTAPDTEDTLEDSELIGDDLDTLLDCFPAEQAPTENHTQAVHSVPRRTSTCARTVPSVLPPPTPQLPPAFFSSAVSQLNSLDSFSRDGCSAATQATLDALDDLSTSRTGGAGASNLGRTCDRPPLDSLDSFDGLDSLDDFLDSSLSTAAAENGSKTGMGAGAKSLDDLLDELDSLDAVSDGGLSVDIPRFGLDQLHSLDTLDSFLSEEGVVAALPPVSISATGLDSLSSVSSTGIAGSPSAAALLMQSPQNSYKKRNNQAQVAVSNNPLSATHEFLQACSACYPRLGEGIYTFVHKPELVHSCKRDVLLCKRKADRPSEWTRVRQLPARTSFSGPFVLCKELLKSGDRGLCKYGERCTFAYNQLEIDVWTEERKGTLDRNLLFEAAPVKLDPGKCIIRLLQEHKGTFVFLCQICYDGKPQIISERSKDNHAICSRNLDARHKFDANKCLAFVCSNPSVHYSKVRPLSVLCHLDLCRQAIRNDCQREDGCHHAHSVIELKTWKVQQNTGISPDEIVKVSTDYYNKHNQNSRKQKGNRLPSGGGGSKGGGGTRKNPDMKMKFACAQCWQSGLISEPDKTLKYCTAKARHPWTTDRRTLLVKSGERSKWVQVRPLPHAKNFPMYYDLCNQIVKSRKCNYSGKCTFAHSQEEKEMWMYMKDNDLLDMQQMYDMWLTLHGHTRQTDESVPTNPAPEEKYIVMPTDYAEPVSGFHCHLCGKHSNSERQWQQHISSEKHKDRVLSCEGEDEALTWSYRFPGTCFELCPKLDSGCLDGVSCDYAHSPEELQEWIKRRDFLRWKLAKAREDMLIMPDECDFGKYNFLLQN